EIDTLNEKYQADIYFEARWTERQLNLNTLNLTTQQQTQLLYENIIVRVDELNSVIHWSPQLFIENAIGQIGEQDRWFTIKRNVLKSVVEISSPFFIDADICEYRRIKGVFWQKLELTHFPVDVQDLTISITSHHHVENCILVQDEQFHSSINREAFFDQQEWSLYEHVATNTRETKEEYSFECENSGLKQKQHPVLAITCRAARRPGYYYWNGFCLIFLITISSFCIFSISPDKILSILTSLPQSRLQITCTLLLTSVTFRWVVNRSLPQISYLTILDIYAILSIIILVLLCVWHSIIATMIFVNNIPARPVESNNIYVLIDRYVFICLFTIYIILHITLIIWLIFVPYKRRRKMNYLDREYVANKYIQIDKNQSKYGSQQDLVFRRSSSINDSLSSMKSRKKIEESESVIIITNNSTFIPIHEKTNDITTKTMNIVKLREQDDDYYHHTNDINDELKSTQIIHAE
ncbi:unnamed protein product, partial [Rotaria sp. Silwood2]